MFIAPTISRLAAVQAWGSCVLVIPSDIHWGLLWCRPRTFRSFIRERSSCSMVRQLLRLPTRSRRLCMGGTRSMTLLAAFHDHRSRNAGSLGDRAGRWKRWRKANTLATSRRWQLKVQWRQSLSKTSKQRGIGCSIITILAWDLNGSGAFKFGYPHFWLLAPITQFPPQCPKVTRFVRWLFDWLSSALPFDAQDWISFDWIHFCPRALKCID